MEQKIFDILVCPICKSPLKNISSSDILVCQPCQTFWPIIDGIPKLLPESGQALDKMGL